MRRYLEARGTEVVVLDRPLSESVPGRGTLVLAFPWQSLDLGASLASDVTQHLNGGGHLLIAYSGGAARSPSGAPSRSSISTPSRPGRTSARAARLAPPRHRGLAPRSGGALEGTARPLVVPAADRVPSPARRHACSTARPGATRSRSARARRQPRGGGARHRARQRARGAAGQHRPAGEPGPEPAGALELRRGPSRPGGAPAPAGGDGQSRVLDLALVQLLALYALVAVTLGRRFGPPWREPPVVVGSTAGFFLGLGALHHRLGHHAEAARRLVARSQELDRNLRLPAELERRAAAGVDAAGLVEIARDVATRRPTP